MYSAVTCLRLIVILIISFPVFAESLKVYSNRYIVQLNVGLAKQSDLNFLADHNLKTIKKYNDILLVTPQSVLSASSDLVLEYDPKNDFCVELLKNNLVKTCIPDFLNTASIDANDPEYSQLWGLKEQGTQANLAWQIHNDSSDIVVAVLDSGVDYNHQDLKANMWVNQLEIPNNGIDDDQNNYIDDVHGVDLITGDGDPMASKVYDPETLNPASYRGGHGTHCAGTIAAVGNNSIGVTGVAWKSKIMALKFLDWKGEGGTLDLIKGLDYVIAMKKRGVNIKVLNASFGTFGYSSLYEDRVRELGELGVIIVAAAGNKSEDNDAIAVYPANFELANIVSVANHDSNFNLAVSSNFGLDTVDLAAPGTRILSTIPDNAYAYMSGTSMAAPHVAGSLSLLLSKEKNISLDSAIKRLYTSGVDHSSLASLIKTGRSLNTYRLLANLNTEVPVAIDPDPCKYSTNEISYNPDLSADRARQVIASDELDYYNLNLPFNFNYQGETYRNMYISPNGKIYLKSEPDYMDFLLTTYPAKNSISIFHTDLDSSDYGVRVKKYSDRVVIYWKAVHAEYKNLGILHIRAELRSNGQINTNVAMSQGLAQALQGKYQILVAGQRVKSIVSFTTNKAKFGVSFVPNCSSNNINPTSNISSIHINNLSKKLSQQKLAIDLNGVGNGIVDFAFRVNSYQCSELAKVNLVNGNAKLLTKIRSNQFDRIKLFANSQTAIGKINLKGNRKNKSIKSANICRNLWSNLQARN